MTSAALASASGGAPGTAPQWLADNLGALAGYSPILLALLGIGLALWLVGDRLFRPAASLIGAALGGALGLATASVIPEAQLIGAPTSYVCVGLGALAGLLAGLALYRLAVGVAASLVLGGLAAAIAASITLGAPGASTSPERPETIAESVAAEASIQHVRFDGPVTPASMQAAAHSARDWAGHQWQAIPEGSRNLLIAAGILGAVVGFAFGTIRPRTAGPAVSALAGAALWLGATAYLLAARDGAAPPPIAERPGASLVAWLLVALIGFAVQRRVIRPAALIAKDE